MGEGNQGAYFEDAMNQARRQTDQPEDAPDAGRMEGWSDELLHLDYKRTKLQKSGLTLDETDQRRLVELRKRVPNWQEINKKAEERYETRKAKEAASEKKTPEDWRRELVDLELERAGQERMGGGLNLEKSKLLQEARKHVPGWMKIESETKNAILIWERTLYDLLLYSYRLQRMGQELDSGRQELMETLKKWFPGWERNIAQRAAAQFNQEKDAEELERVRRKMYDRARAQGAGFQQQGHYRGNFGFDTSAGFQGQTFNQRKASFNAGQAGFQGARQEAPRSQKTDNLTQAFSLMGIAQNATPEDVKKVYRQFVLENHPDKTSHLPESERKRREENFKTVSDGYRLWQGRA